MNKVIKDNLTDLISDLADLVEPESSGRDESKKPMTKPHKGLNDYQVTTPDGEVIDMTFESLAPLIQKNRKNSSIKKILGGKSKNGLFYALVVTKLTT